MSTEDDMGLFAVDDFPIKPYEKFRPLMDFPKRRDVKGLKLEVNGLTEGDTLTFLYEDEVYGRSIVQGAVRKSDVGESPVYTVAGIQIAKRNKTKKEWEPIGSEMKKVIADTELDFVSDDASVEHGDFAIAEFESDAYGSFTVLGQVTEGEENPLTLVNKWIVKGLNGPGRNLVKVTRLAPNGEHDVPLVGKRPRIDIDDV